MAINTKLTNKKGVLEKNAVTYPRTGNIMAMYPLDSTVTEAENGMLLGVNYVTGKIEYPTSSSVAVMIMDSVEKEYDVNEAGLNQFSITPTEGYYPRLGKLEVNDRFTTSTVAYDSASYADDAAIETAIENGLYGVICTTAGYKGYIELTSSKPTTAKVGLQAIALTTLPNGDKAIKFAVILAA